MKYIPKFLSQNKCYLKYYQGAMNGFLSTDLNLISFLWISYLTLVFQNHIFSLAYNFSNSKVEEYY